DRQCARLGRGRGAGAVEFSAGAGADRARQRSRAAQRRNVVARPGARARRDYRSARRNSDRIGLSRRAAGPWRTTGGSRRGIDFVAKEAVTLSTTPVWRNGRLEPRPFTLRLFLARTSDGWRVMPGGFVRVADDIDARAVSLQRGGSTGDAWVLS